MNIQQLAKHNMRTNALNWRRYRLGQPDAAALFLHNAKLWRAEAGQPIGYPELFFCDNCRALISPARARLGLCWDCETLTQ